jgi:hypothetical protein
MNFKCLKYLHDIKWLMFHDLLDIALGPLKKGGSKIKLGIVAINWIVINS